MEEENGNSGNSGEPDQKSEPGLQVPKFRKDYLLLWRGQTRAYYLTELGIYEAAFRSRASLIGVGQIPMVGGAINRKLSKKAAADNLTLATIQILKENGRITKEILWKDVQKGTINGNKFSVIGKYENLKFTFLKHWERTDWGRSINYIMAAYLGKRFTTTLSVPPNVVEIVNKAITDWTADGSYQSPRGITHPVPSGVSQEKRVVPLEESLPATARTGQELPVTEVDQDKHELPESPKKRDVADDVAPTKKKNGVRKSPKTVSPRMKKQISAAFIAVIVVAAALMVLHNDIYGDIKRDPSTTYTNHVYSANTVLKSSVFASNITIDPGVTLTTDGFNFFVTGSFINHGTIITGHKYIAQNITSSYGGSGGGGGFSFTTNSVGLNGFRTSYPAGIGGFPGTSGISSTLSAVSANNLSQWYNSSASGVFPDSMAQYLMGASGGLSGNFHNSGAAVPGDGAYGIVIEANYISAGVIEANGTGDSGGGAGAGGGGGGVILLLYGSGGVVNGTYNVLGGSGVTPGVSYANNYGGNGGNGIVLQEYITGRL